MADTGPERTESHEALRAHNALFLNCDERPKGSGNYVLPTCKKLLYAWPGLGFYMVRRRNPLVPLPTPYTASQIAASPLWPPPLRRSRCPLWTPAG